MSQPIAKNRIFWVRDMLRLGLGAEADSCGASGVNAVSSFSLMRYANFASFSVQANCTDPSLRSK
jgi:hypothetical protein